ncbi:MAG: hypothetical protein ABSA12_11000 [Verrucomicrobiia bacterium]
MLFTFLWLASCVVPVLGAVHTGSTTGGVPGALIGLGVGAAMGFGNFFAAGRLGKALKHWRARAKEQRRSSASVECFLGLAYFGLLFWIIASELLGMYITRFIAGVHFQNVKLPLPN